MVSRVVKTVDLFLSSVPFLIKFSFRNPLITVLGTGTSNIFIERSQKNWKKEGRGQGSRYSVQ